MPFPLALALARLLAQKVLVREGLIEKDTKRGGSGEKEEKDQLKEEKRHPLSHLAANKGLTPSDPSSYLVSSHLRASFTLIIVSSEVFES